MHCCTISSTKNGIKIPQEYISQSCPFGVGNIPMRTRRTHNYWQLSTCTAVVTTFLVRMAAVCTLCTHVNCTAALMYCLTTKNGLQNTSGEALTIVSSRCDTPMRTRRSNHCWIHLRVNVSSAYHVFGCCLYALHRLVPLNWCSVVRRFP